MSIRRNTAVNVAAAIVPMLVLLVTVPQYLRLLGQERYGVLSLAWLMLGYLSFADFALGRATARQVAQTADADDAARSEIFWSALLSNFAVGLVGAALVWAGGRLLLPHVLHAAVEFRSEALAALPWFALTLPVALTTSVLQGALEGRSRFGTVAVLQVSGNVLFQLVPLVVAQYLSPQLQFVIPAAVVSKVALNIALFVACRRLVVVDSRVRFALARVGTLFTHGGWFAVAGVTGTVIDSLDRVVIAAVLGAQAVARYAVPYQLAARVTVIPTAAATTLFPQFARSTDGELPMRAFDAVAALLTPIVITGLLVIGPFLHWWVGPELASVATPLGCVLLVGVWAAGLAQVPLTTVMGSREPRLVAVAYLAQVLPYAALMFILTRDWGLVGAAVAWLLRAYADCLVLCWLAGMARRAIKHAAGSLALVLAAASFALVLPQAAAVPSGIVLLAVSIFAGRHQLAFVAAPILARIRSS